MHLLKKQRTIYSCMEDACMWISRLGLLTYFRCAFMCIWYGHTSCSPFILPSLCNRTFIVMLPFCFGFSPMLKVITTAHISPRWCSESITTSSSHLLAQPLSPSQQGHRRQRQPCTRTNITLVASPMYTIQHDGLIFCMYVRVCTVFAPVSQAGTHTRQDCWQTGLIQPRVHKRYSWYNLMN